MKQFIYTALIAFSFVLTGCTTAMLAGKSGTKFQASVSDVYDASLAELQEQNYPILRKMITNDVAKIDSEFPSGEQLDIVIRQLSPDYTATSVRVGAISDDHRAYTFMKKLEARVEENGQNNQRDRQTSG